MAKLNATANYFRSGCGTHGRGLRPAALTGSDAGLAILPSERRQSFFARSTLGTVIRGLSITGRMLVSSLSAPRIVR